MPEIKDIAHQYHDAYCEASGLKVKYTFSLYSDWYLFAKDFEMSDLGTVIRYLKRLYKDKPDILRACIRLPKLIQDHSMFAAYLAEADEDARREAANARAHVKSRATKAREAWRGLPEAPEEKAKDTSKSIGQILPTVQQALDEMRKLKDSLKP